MEKKKTSTDKQAVTIVNKGAVKPQTKKVPKKTPKAKLIIETPKKSK